MSTKIINVFGYVANDNQFIVKAQDFNIRINNNTANGNSETPNPLEYLLAGFAGSVNAIGQIVAKELGIELKSLQVEISGTLVDKNEKTKKGRAGFKSIEIVVKPSSDAPLALLKEWIDTVKERCPVRDTLLNATPVLLTLIKEYAPPESI
ncbi:OsmC family protein [Flavobacterium sp.]|uniref:OsmC family protein n=1 Tax=Flavobacterium sp. TaxID=239 RepID=UPI002B4AD575|nr:OsmC family protein [Flavobacterium sp.]HLF52937.1 OsmC family protein [Flavobacterium sp.]